MRCSGCGRKVSFRGLACRYCGADKSKDRKKLVLAGSSLVAGGLIGSGVGTLGILVGLFLGGATGTLVGLVKYGSEEYLPKAGGASGEPEVTTVPGEGNEKVLLP
jgi:hypothetical protein